MGPPGSSRKENAVNMGAVFQWNVINTGDLLKKEVDKESEIGVAIRNDFRNHSYVEDKHVIEVVKREISNCEKNSKSWIIQGFPRTKI